MLSLRDQLQNFEGLTYSLELQRFIPIEQRFMSETITVQSLIQENNFILSEFKKMSALFLNFCKLNTKVYSRLCQHELSAQEQLARMQHIANSTNQNAELSLLAAKMVQQELVSQIQMHNQQVQSVVHNVESQFAEKVDKKDFFLEMNKLLEIDKEEQATKEMQDQPIHTAYNNDTATIILPSKSQSPQKKKKKLLTVQEFLLFKTECESRFEDHSSTLAVISKSIESEEELSHTLITRLNAHEQKMHALSETQSLHTKELNVQLQAINKVCKTLSQQLSSLPSHMQVTVEKHHRASVEPLFIELKNIINKNDREYKEKQSLMRNSINKIQADLKIKENDIKKNRENVEKNNKMIQNNKNLGENKMKIVEQKIKNVEEKMNEWKGQICKKIDEKQEEYIIKNKGIEKQIKQLSESIGVIVERNVMKKMQKALNILQKEQMACNTKQLQLNSQFSGLHSQLTHMQNVLAKKANFTDLLFQSEKKVDREDFKTFKSAIMKQNEQQAMKQLENAQQAPCHTSHDLRKESSCKQTKRVRERTLREEEKKETPRIAGIKQTEYNNCQTQTVRGNSTPLVSGELKRKSKLQGVRTIVRNRTSWSKTSKTLFIDEMADLEPSIKLFMCGIERAMPTTVRKAS